MTLRVPIVAPYMWYQKVTVARFVPPGGVGDGVGAAIGGGVLSGWPSAQVCQYMQHLEALVRSAAVAAVQMSHCVWPGPLQA